MPTIQVGPSSAHDLQQIADILGKSRKVVVVTGAGISTNCGLPDFRSEDGLYALIQAQYDAASKDPPWEHSNYHENDDRPRKKRKQWFYEVVAPDGTVVDVIDEDAAPLAGPEPDSHPHASSLLDSSDTTISNSRSSTPGQHSSDESSLSSCPSLLSEIIGLESLATEEKDEHNILCPPQIPATYYQEQDHVQQQQPCRRSARYSSPLVNRVSATTHPPTDAPSSTKNSSPTAAGSMKVKRTPLPNSSLDNSTSTSSSPSNSTTSKPLTKALQRANSSFISTSTDRAEPSTAQSSQSSSRSLPNLKGRDLFDCMVWNDSFTTSIFYMFISSLRQKVQEVKNTSETHKFLRVLRDGGRLVRTYTQNIDLLETREGLSTDLSLGPGNRGRFSYKTQRERQPDIIDRSSAFYRGVECVLLHGSLVELRCGICSTLSSWDDHDRIVATSAGTAPDCPDCSAYNSRRTSANRRGLAIGRLRPNIVLYGEEHPNANLIAPLITHDLSLGPDVMLIMGTSLKVHGFKIMVREFAKAAHNKGGKVVFINNTKPSESVWGDVIDYWVAWDCDQWVLDLKRRREDIWMPQGAVLEAVDRKESAGNIQTAKKIARPQCQREDKNNGVYITFKIMDILRSVPDAKGQPSSRDPYWPATTRQSTGKLSVTHEKQPQPSIKRSMAASVMTTGVAAPLESKPQPTAKSNCKAAPSDIRVKSRKRRSHPIYDKDYLDDKENLAYKIAETWERMRKSNPKLPSAPPELKIPFSNLAGNMPNFFQTSFAFDGFVPNLGGNISSLAGMNLRSLPPSDPTIVVKPQKVLPLTNHCYGTRSRRLSEPLDVAAAKAATPLPSSRTPGSDVSRSPMTPSSHRIKRISSIGNLVSSPEDGVEIYYDASEIMT